MLRLVVALELCLDSRGLGCAVGAIACADRNGGLAAVALRLAELFRLTQLLRGGLLRLGVKRLSCR